MSILLSHPSGNTFVLHALKAFQQHVCLETFFTTLGFSKSSPFYKFPFPRKIRELLNRRAYPVNPHKLHTHPTQEITRLICQHLGLSSLVAHQKGPFCFDAICQSHDRYVARHLAKTPSIYKALYSYEDCCLESFQEARQHGLHCFYEVPIAYWEATQHLLKEEAQRYPEWEPTLLAMQDSDEKLMRKTEELRLAQHIICPSNFVYDTLPEEIRKNIPCSIIPYGAPTIPPHPKGRKPQNKLRVLFAGALSQRKGLADLFAAMKILNRSDVELVVFGSLLAPESFYRKQSPHFIYEPPRSNAEVLQLMQCCDILVLPSIVEGRAIVQLEALSCGLPLIITPNTGGNDLIEEGQTGFIVPIRTPQAIAEKLNWFCENRSHLPEMQLHCIKKAQEASWKHFEKQLAATVLEKIS